MSHAGHDAAQELDRFEDFRSDLGMLFDFLVLFGREPIRLGDDRVRDPDLADIMEQPSEIDSFDQFLSQSHPIPDA